MTLDRVSTPNERKYALTRISAGDYILPSNDAQTLWRIHSYTEDGSASFIRDDGTEQTLRGTYWATAKFRKPVSLVWDDFLDWEHWETWETTLRTRADAIRAALR